jgi:hypothetical protein
MVTIVKLLLCLLLWAPINSIAIEAPTIEEAALLDIITTAIAENHGGVEMNPLGVTGTLIVKYVMINAVNNIDDKDRRKDLQNFGSAFWTGAAANNLAVAFGAPPIISLSVMVAVYLHLRQK